MMRALGATIRANVPVLLWGTPGVGKTSIIETHFPQAGYHVETIVGSNREPSDYLGLPIHNRDTNTVEYAALDWATRLVHADKGLLFLDEFSTAAPSVQKAMLRIVQEREVGCLTLPDTVAIVAAANPVDQAADGWDLAPPVANRFMHLDWAFNVDAWLDGALTGFDQPEPISLDSLLGDGGDEAAARVRGIVTGFLRARPDLLAPNPPVDPSESGGAWPSPRSWENMMRVLTELRHDDEAARMLAIQGCVGDAAATEFIAWSATADLHSPLDVLADPTIVAWRDE